MQNAVSHPKNGPALLLRKLSQHNAGSEPESSPAPALPAYLAVIRRSGGQPAEFPVCVITGEEALSIRPVEALITEAANSSLLTSDEAERQTRVVRRLIREIAGAAGSDKEKTLTDLWGAAATAMIADPDLPEFERESIRQVLNRIRKQVEIDGPVIAFHPRTPSRLLRLVEERRTVALRAKLVSEVEALVERLNKELELGVSDKARSVRLAAVVEHLQVWKHQVALNGKSDEVPAERSLQSYIKDKVQERLSFFRALHIARLEAEHAYQDDEHDALFDSFSMADLSVEDRESFSPVTVKVESERLGEVSSDAILSLLEGDVPVKLLVTVGSYDPECLSGWQIRLAERAMAIGRVYVMQAAASQALTLLQGFQEGMQFAGPALFVVFTGAQIETHGVEADLYAQLAHDSRISPSFLFDPSAGEDPVSRFRLVDNKQPDQRWYSFHAADTTGKGDGTDFLITAADFMVCDSRMTGEYMPVPAGTDPSLLAPLNKYLDESEEARASKVPFIRMTDLKGKEYQVVVSPVIVRAVETVSARWRNLQEWGGIDNSYANRAVASEKERMLVAFEKEKESLYRRHQEEIEQLKGSMAQQIVSNIAAGLLGLGADGVDFSADLIPAAPVKTPSPTVTALKVSEPQVTSEPDPIVEEEERLSLDEAYIDTPDCTSCDECINRNDKIFAYNEDGKAYVKDPRGGPYRDLVEAAEQCPAHIIHPGKPLNPDEPELADLQQRAEPYL